MLCIGKEMLQLIELYHLQDWCYINLQSSLIAAVTCKLPKEFCLSHLTQRGFLAVLQTNLLNLSLSHWSVDEIVLYCIVGKRWEEQKLLFSHILHAELHLQAQKANMEDQKGTRFSFNCRSNRQNGLCTDLREKQLPDKGKGCSDLLLHPNQWNT